MNPPDLLTLLAQPPVLDQVDTFTSTALAFTSRLGLGFLLLWLGSKIVGRIAKLIKKVIFGRIFDQTISSFVYSSISIGLRIILILSVFSIWGMRATTFIAIFGAFSLAIGLALQGSMSNVASGVLLLLLKPFKVGDYIKVQTWSGTVKKIELFFTTIATLDNRVVVIPNSLLTSQVLTNFSRYPERRIDVPFQVNLETDLTEAKRVLLEVCHMDPDVIKEEHSARIIMTGHHNGIATLEMQVWIPRDKLISARERLTQAGFRALKSSQIELPRQGVALLEEDQE